MRLGHDVFLRTDVFLLPRVDNVSFLQDFHGVCLHLLILQLNLNKQPTSGHHLFTTMDPHTGTRAGIYPPLKVVPNE